MTKRKRSLLLSAMTLMLCLALVAGGTYALFTDSETLRTHLVAGDLDITLKRVGLESKTLGEGGFLYSSGVDDTVVDYTNRQNRHINVFGIDDRTLIVPCSSYIATMEIKNDESDVAFGYWVEIYHVTNDPEKISDAELLSQIEVKIEAANGKVITKRLSEGLNLGDDEHPIAIIPTGGMDNFKVTLTFVDDRVDSNIVNNDAMNNNAYFDVIVHAVQVTDNPNAAH